MSDTPPSALEVRHLRCARDPASVRVEQLGFARGVFHLLAGGSDSGHELLLRVLGLLELPEEGEIFVEDEAVHALDEETRRKLRERRLGFVFAAPFLLPAFTVIENVAMPLFKVSDVEPAEARLRSEALLDFAGLMTLAQTPCAELAPLEQQRVSLARALVNEPSALLVESLDSTLAGEDLRTFAALLREAAARFDIAVVATASPQFVAEPDDRIIEVTNGTVRLGGKLLPQADR